MKKLITLVIALGALAVWSQADETKCSTCTTCNKSTQVTVTGEVLDMACYLDHGASGPKHAGCAEKCVRSGLPVGLKTEAGKVYLLIGEHKPINDTLADYAGKTVTIKGKAVSRDGINLLENAELVQ